MDVLYICNVNVLFSAFSGKPKGVMLTHKNIATNIESFKNYEVWSFGIIWFIGLHK